MKMRRWMLFAGAATTIAAASVVGYLYWSGQLPFGSVEERIQRRIDRHPADREPRLALAELCAHEERWQEAIAVLQEGLRHASNDPSLLRRMAELYALWGKATRSEKKHLMAAKYWKRLIDTGADTLENKLAWVDALLVGGLRQEAATVLEPLATAHPGNADVFLRLAGASKQLGKYERALALAKTASQLAPRDYRIWHWMAEAQAALGDYPGAVESMKRALENCHNAARSGIARLLVSAEELASNEPSNRTFWAHYKIGYTMSTHENRPDRGAAEFQRCLALLPPNTRDYDMRVASGWAHRSIFDFNAYLGKHEEGLEHIEAAFEEFTAVGDTRSLAFCASGLTAAYAAMATKYPDRKQEMLDKEEEAHEKKLHAAKAARLDHFLRHAVAERTEFLVARYGIEDPRVRESRKELLALLPEKTQIDDCAHAALVRTEAGILCKEAKYEDAERLYSAVAPYFATANHHGQIQGGPYVFGTLAYLAARRNDFDSAIDYCNRALERLTVMRNGLGADQFRREVGGNAWRTIFNNVIYYCENRDDISAAFNYCEQYKARALLDLLGSKADDRRRQSPIHMAKTDDIEDLHSHGEAQRPQEHVQEFHGPLRDLALEAAAFQRLPEDTAAATLQVPSFINATPFQLEQLQPMMTEITLVTYFLGESATAFVLSRDSVHCIRLSGVYDENLKTDIEAFQDALGIAGPQNRDLALEPSAETRAAGPSRLDALSEQLYTQLVEPVLPYLTENTICICPDGILNNLPFEALRKNGRHLLEDFAIFYAPSASVLKLCMDRNRHGCGAILALGNPNLQNPAFRLYNAEEEVNALRAFFPQADVLTGDAATETAVKERAASYDVLHFACHGELNMDDPMLTSLRLAPDAGNDGYLHAGEIFDLDLNASLVVLSACNTALGELSTGNELMGLPRSFLYAGAPAIIASLWTVDDRSTYLLMQRFYENLAVMNKAQALRQAKLAIMKEYPNPFYWAAFCLQGDYR